MTEHRAIDTILGDCRAIVASVVEIRAATSALAAGRRGENLYDVAAAAYCDATARGSRIRAELAGAAPSSPQANIAFAVGIMLQRACEAFHAFLELRSDAGLYRLPS